MVEGQGAATGTGSDHCPGDGGGPGTTIPQTHQNRQSTTTAGIMAPLVVTREGTVGIALAECPTAAPRDPTRCPPTGEIPRSSYPRGDLRGGNEIPVLGMRPRTPPVAGEGSATEDGTLGRTQTLLQVGQEVAAHNGGTERVTLGPVSLGMDHRCKMCLGEIMEESMEGGAVARAECRLRHRYHRHVTRRQPQREGAQCVRRLLSRTEPSAVCANFPTNREWQPGARTAPAGMRCTRTASRRLHC